MSSSNEPRRPLEDQLLAYGEAFEQHCLDSPATTPPKRSRGRMIAAATVLLSLGAGIAYLVLDNDGGGLTDLRVQQDIQAPTTAAQTSDLEWTQRLDGPLTDLGILPAVAISPGEVNATILGDGQPVVVASSGETALAELPPPGLTLVSAAVTTEDDVYLVGYSASHETQFKRSSQDGWVDMASAPNHPASPGELVVVEDAVGYVYNDEESERMAISFYRPERDAWSEPAIASIAARDSAGLAVVDSTVVVWGGCKPAGAQCDDGTDESVALDDGAIFDTSSGVWEQLGASPLAPGYAITASADEGLVYLFVGMSESGQPEAARLDPAEGNWERLADPPLTSRKYATSVVVAGNWVVFGGVSERALADGSALDLPTLEWTSLPSAPSPRERHTMFALGRRAYVVGGHGSEGWLELSAPEN